MSFALLPLHEHRLGAGPEGARSAFDGLSAIVEVHTRRLELLYRLLASPEGATVPDLAEAFRLTSAAVRVHLARLVTAGLVIEERLPPVGPGRPRNRYRAAEAAAVLLASGSLLDQLSGLLDDDRSGRCPKPEAADGSGISSN